MSWSCAAITPHTIGTSAILPPCPFMPRIKARYERNTAAFKAVFREKRFCLVQNRFFISPDTEDNRIMDQLEQSRMDIEQIDRDMASLFCRRMDAARRIAAYKKEHALPILNEERERLLLEKNTALIPDEALKNYYVNFLRAVMDVSKQYQHRLLSGIHVAYSGVEGAFADIAAKRIFPDGTHTGYPNFQAAYDAVVQGACDCAVLPVENSYAGAVGQVIDLMFEGPLYVSGVYTLPITQNLLGVSGATVKTVQRVISHPQALSQCAAYIRQHGYETVSAVNTAVAAQQTAQAGDITTAAIASAETAALYGLEILDHDINESMTNTTKFAVFSRVPNTTRSRENKFILLFTINDVAGALAKAINVISDHGFNMKALRSRPVRDHDWQYYFYVEAEGDDASEQGQAMLQNLARQCETLKVAGHYTAEISLKGCEKT